MVVLDSHHRESTNSGLRRAVLQNQAAVSTAHYCKVLVVVVVAHQALFKFRHVKQGFCADSARQLSNESNVLGDVA